MTEQEKVSARSRLEEEWSALTAVLKPLTAADMEQPGVVENWSVKDILGHMAFWTEKAVGDLRLATSGKSSEIQVPGGEAAVADWNARESATRSGKSLKELEQELNESYEAARAALDETPPQVLEQEVQGWTMFVRFREDTYSHYHEHAQQIREWKRQVETTEA